MSCSINKLKSQMLFTCKSFIFCYFSGKKICSRKWWWWWGYVRHPPSPTLFSLQLKLNELNKVNVVINFVQVLINVVNFLSEKDFPFCFPQMATNRKSFLQFLKKILDEGVINGIIKFRKIYLSIKIRHMTKIYIKRQP